MNLFAVFFFIFGLIIGSFLNVVIYRFNTKRSLGGRSACMSCGHQLAWYELIPIFSFLGLRGRCLVCKTKISAQYIFVELLSGLIFLALFYKLQDVLFNSPNIFVASFAYYAFLFSTLLVIAVYDLKHKIIPDSLAAIFGLFAFAGIFFFNSSNFVFVGFHIPTLWQLLSGVLIALPFALFWLISWGKWMGLGDAKLALGIGWLLGVAGGLSALVVAFWSGAIVGIALIIISKIRKMGRVGMKSEIPFAPFLVLGSLAAFMYGLNLFNLWL